MARTYAFIRHEVERSVVLVFVTDKVQLARLDLVDHVDVERITPMAVPLMVIVGREGLPPGSADEALLYEAETLAAAAMELEAPSAATPARSTAGAARRAAERRPASQRED